MKEGWLKVEIESPTKEVVESYYEINKKLKIKGDNPPRVFKKAKILGTFDSLKYPVNSVWMMGESEGIEINFFGESIRLIQEKDIYERID